MDTSQKLSFVSVIIPCRNEEQFIGKCLDSVLRQDYPEDNLEVLIIDGMSNDNTRDIVANYAEHYPFIKMLDNPSKITPCALNTGIRNARGEIIIRLDAHADYDPTYISKCVVCLEKYNADNVGGVMITRPRKDTLLGRAIAIVLSHPFGVGNSAFRIGSKEPKWVDTVFGGCYRRTVFEKIGLFNEKLARGQDMEFNLRLKKAGLKTLIVPEITSYYYARSDMKSFLKHNFTNGIWVILPFKYSEIIPVSPRSLVPLFFALSLIISGVFSIFLNPFSYLFIGISGLYLLTNLIVSAKISCQKRDSRYLFMLPFIFASLHLTWGLGSVLGMSKVLVAKEFWIMRLRQSHGR